MKTLDSRLNELERTLNADNGQTLPCFLDIQGNDTLQAYGEYKAHNLGQYPQLASMSLADYMESPSRSVIHITFGDYAKKEGAVC